MESAAPTCSSSSGTSSPKYEFSDSDSDQKRSRPHRLPTSNSKNAVAARMNLMKQKKFVKDLKQKMSRLKREIKDVERLLREREQRLASCRRKENYLRGMIANILQLRNIYWRNIVPQEERDNNRPMDQPLQVEHQNDEDVWALQNDIDDSTTEVGVCLHVSNRRISIEFCDECSARFYDDPFGPQI